MEGRLNKFAGERALLEQDFIKDPKKTVNQHIKETISTIGKSFKMCHTPFPFFSAISCTCSCFKDVLHSAEKTRDERYIKNQA